MAFLRIPAEGEGAGAQMSRSQRKPPIPSERDGGMCAHECAQLCVHECRYVHVCGVSMCIRVYACVVCAVLVCVHMCTADSPPC